MTYKTNFNGTVFITNNKGVLDVLTESELKNKKEEQTFFQRVFNPIRISK